MKRVLTDGIRIPNKTLVCGHVGACYGHLLAARPDLAADSAAFDREKSKIMKNAKANAEWFSTFVGDGVIGLDGRCYDTGNVNVLVLDEDR